MATVSNPEMTYTISDFIKEGKASDQTSYPNFSVIRNTPNGKFVDDNILNLYIDELKKICFRIPVENITVSEKARYRYSPDIIAYDFYGSTQLDFIVLICNGIIDPKEFDFEFRYLYMPSPELLPQFLSDVLSSENTYIKQGSN